MWKIAPWLCAGIVIGVGLVSMSGDHSTAQPLESSRYTNPACAYAANASTSTSFICVADLDGNGQKRSSSVRTARTRRALAAVGRVQCLT